MGSVDVRALSFVVGSTRLGFIWSGRAHSPLAMLAASAVLDVSAFPPRPVAMPQTEGFGHFMLALAFSSYVELPSGQVLFASWTADRQESRLMLSWMDLGSLEITRSNEINLGAYEFNYHPTLAFVDGDDEHVYLVDSLHGICASVNVETGNVDRCAWLNCEEDPDVDLVLAMPIRNDRWFLMDSEGRYNLLVGTHGEDTSHDGRPLFRRFVQMDSLACLGVSHFLGGNLLLLFSWAGSRWDLHLARLDADLLASCAPDAPPPQPLAIVDTYRTEGASMREAIDVLHRGDAPHVRRTGNGGRLEVVIPAVDSSSIVVLIEDERIVYCQHVPGHALFPSTVADPCIEACWRLVREMQEERVLRAAAAAGGLALVVPAR